MAKSQLGRLTSLHCANKHGKNSDQPLASMKMFNLLLK